MRAFALSCSFLPLALAACGNPGDASTGGTGGDGGAGPVDAAAGGDLESSTGSCVAVPRTCAEVMATFASDATDLTVTCDEAGGTFTLRSMGLPNYDSNQTTGNRIEDQMWTVVFPLAPRCSDKTTDVVNSRGPIGFMINGVPFYGPQDAQGRDALQFEGKSFDDCDGHADQSCSYHYHTEPVCVFAKGQTAAQHRLADGHPPVVGYALDGFAIYASPADGALDACNGHADGKRGYHYHATKSSPYLVGCYHGTESGKMTRVPACMSGMGGGGPDGGMMQPPDGGMGMGALCGQGMACMNGQVCCPIGLPCGGHCVPDCRQGAMCPGMLSCDQQTGVCK